MSLTFIKVTPPAPHPCCFFSVFLQTFIYSPPPPPPPQPSPSTLSDLAMDSKTSGVILQGSFHSKTPDSLHLFFSFHSSHFFHPSCHSSNHHLPGQANLSSDSVSLHRSVRLSDQEPARKACQAHWHTWASGSAQISLPLSRSYSHFSSVSLVLSFPNAVTLSHGCQPTLQWCQSKSERTNNTLPLTLTNEANLQAVHRHDHGCTRVSTCICGKLCQPSFLLSPQRRRCSNNKCTKHNSELLTNTAQVNVCKVT